MHEYAYKYLKKIEEDCVVIPIFKIAPIINNFYPYFLP